MLADGVNEKPESSRESSGNQTKSCDDNAEEGKAFMTVELSKESGLLGVIMVGGTDTIMKEVKRLLPDGATGWEGTLPFSDHLVSVNGNSVSGKTQRQAADLVREGGTDVTFLYRPESQNERSDQAIDKTTTTVPVAELVDSATIWSQGEVDGLKTVRVRVDVHRSLSSIDARLEPASSLEAIEIEKGACGLGFSVGGGRASSEGNLPIVVQSLFAGGAAEKSERLLPKDHILKVNGQDFSVLTREEAVDILEALPEGTVSLLVRKADPSAL